MRRREFLKLGCGAGVLACAGCVGDLETLLPARTGGGPTDGLTLLARLAHLTDTHIVDEESPARFAGAQAITHSAWRPYEAYSTQLLDGLIRTVNRIHAAGRPIDFLLHTGDACDNAQHNELAWVLALLDGGDVNPLSGPDDRPPATRPPTWLDPHAPFVAQGLYRQGVHGDGPTIPWYALLGNHDANAIGVFPIIEDRDGRRRAPLPLPGRPGIWLPTVLDPLAIAAHGNVTPAEPGPPCLFETARPVAVNAERAYFNTAEFQAALATTTSGPAGHGFADQAWYSVSPAPGVRLIGLDTTVFEIKVAGGVYSEGGLTADQVAILRAELAAAEARGEVVIVATHHPSEALLPTLGSAVDAAALRRLLNTSPNVVLHLAGHRHRNRVADRGGYLEIETCSTLDLPQEGRLVELWQNDAGGVVIAYGMFSHLDDELPPLGDDPLRELRARAYALAAGDKTATARQRRFDPSGAPAAGLARDRTGMVRKGIPPL